MRFSGLLCLFRPSPEVVIEGRISQFLSGYRKFGRILYLNEEIYIGNDFTTDVTPIRIIIEMAFTDYFHYIV